VLEWLNSLHRQKKEIKAIARAASSTPLSNNGGKQPRWQRKQPQNIVGFAFDLLHGWQWPSPPLKGKRTTSELFRSSKIVPNAPLSAADTPSEPPHAPSDYTLFHESFEAKYKIMSQKNWWKTCQPRESGEWCETLHKKMIPFMSCQPQNHIVMKNDFESINSWETV